MKKVVVPLVNRTNYTKIKPILFSLREKDLDLRILASSSLILERYAETYHDIIQDGFNIDTRINCALEKDSHESMAITFGLSAIQHANYLEMNRPDMALIVGDRFDMCPVAMSCSLMNIPIAHIQGGEKSGTIDDKIRDVISTVSTLHFVSTDKSKERLSKLGIDSNNIFNFGCPAVEYIINLDSGSKFDLKRLHKSFKKDIKITDKDRYFLVLVHPDTTNEKDIDMEILLSAINSIGEFAFVFYPNIDANNSHIVNTINKFRKDENFYIVKHVPIEGYIHLLAHCNCLIGNSSSGIREAASFGIPVINIGNRQNGRERNKNTIDIPCEKDVIVSTIKKYMDYKFPKENIYYRENCVDNISSTIYNFLN